jgi:TIR domain
MSKQKGEYDVFVSYSSKDLAWVKNELLEYLEKHGFTVCIDYRDFEPGKSSIQNMEHAILNSRKTLLILTADYIASAWTEFENILLQTLDPTNKESRIIPLMKNKEGTKLPLRLKALTYLNFYDPIDKDLEYQRLLKILSGVKKKDSFSFDDKWVGRQKCIKDLSYKITQKSCRLLILSGITGIGKSALGERIAMELSDWLRNDWSYYQRENFEDSGQSSEFTNIASKWLEKWGEIVTPEDRKDSRQLLDRLAKKLCTQRYLIQIDSLENILEGNEDNGWSNFKDPLWNILGREGFG